MKRIKHFKAYAELLKIFVQDILELLKEEEEGEAQKKLALSALRINAEELRKRFSFPEEVDTILYIARQYFPKTPESYPLNPFALLLAIREAERGRAGFEFGIVKVKNTDLKTQCEYACETIKNNFSRFKAQRKERDFIAYLGKRYAPIGAENDPDNLNRNWVHNVRWFYERFVE
ncbi:MAG: hypothetical protein J7J32_00280 [Candidatus Atribacteria bacterium]|nr:hypothetical protein [Candidatus Atribacteria bacterium]MCD6349645.1 hypothetical protein [Candidatus Atribacteria bacterium]